MSDDLIARLREWRAGTHLLVDESGRETGETEDEPKSFTIMQKEREEAAAQLAFLAEENKRLRDQAGWPRKHLYDQVKELQDVLASERARAETAEVALRISTRATKEAEQRAARLDRAIREHINWHGNMGHEGLSRVLQSPNPESETDG